ncbi:MAG: SdrD B-like domain-containing protein [Caldilineaceae bacterium]
MQKKRFEKALAFSLLYIAWLVSGWTSGLRFSVFNIATAASYAASCTGSQITGAAFRDYNANGVQDANEPGIAGIVVTIYAAHGSATTCETASNGGYRVDPSGPFPVRVEFTLPSDGQLNFLQAGVAGPHLATTVMFLNGPATGVDVGFNNPDQYCGPTSAPDVATACYVFGEQNNNPDGVNKNRDVLVSFPYTAGSIDLTNEAGVRNPTPTHRALAQEIGSVWGLAWQPQQQILYAAAFLKRHAGFGPHGPGAIYQVTPAGASLFYDFGALAGVDPHPAPGTTCLSPGHNPNKSNSNCWLNDPNAFDLIGKIGFGDLEISEDYTTLYTVNLAQKTLLVIPIATPNAASSLPVPSPASCGAGDLRPFGLGVNDGIVYVGLVCTAEATQNLNQLRAYVYAYANGSFKGAPSLEFPLTYNRGATNLNWTYWLNRSTFNPNDARQKAGKWAQPWLTDISFDQGDMLLALRDRDGDQFGTVAGGPDPNDPNNYSAVVRGDILRACATGNGQWQLETNGQCGNFITAGKGNSQGPGGGEYYFQDEQLDPFHHETSLGAQLQVPGQTDVVSTILNPIEGHSAVSDSGIKWYNNHTGATTRGYLINDASSDPALFQKAGGLGDLVALCEPAPIEIGNRVWRDTNRDGVQDPDEPGIDAVTVELYRNGVLVGATVTANGGQYYFNADTVKLNGAQGIVPGTGAPGGASAYEIRIPNSTGNNQQDKLNGLTLTLANHDASAQGELRDSDGRLQGNNAVFVVPYGDLMSPGYNNHTYDFGFVQTAPPPLTAVTPTPTLTPTPTPTEVPSATPTAAPSFTPQPSATPVFSIGNLVWFDADNNGFVDPGERGLAGVAVALYRSDAAATGETKLLKTMTTNADGYYLFTGLAAGVYQVEVKPPVGYTSSTGGGFLNTQRGRFEAAPAPDSDPTDNDDNGTTFSNVVRSGLVTLTLGGEPRHEPATPGLPDDTPDANANYTVDLGFFELPTALEVQDEPPDQGRIFLPLVVR